MKGDCHTTIWSHQFEKELKSVIFQIYLNVKKGAFRQLKLDTKKQPLFVKFCLFTDHMFV